jgi:6-phosphofructokinase
VLGSSRDKPDQEYCERIIKAFQNQNIRTFFYIGGNDSSDTCRIVSEVAARSGYELKAFHVPKTVDNDLMENDHTPGYPSAARFVACAFIGDDLDNRSLPGVKINVVMGRNAGFLTAASVMARRKEGDGPHLIHVPELAFNLERFLGRVESIYAKHGRCLISVSEGIHDAEGTPMVTKLAGHLDQDAHGNVQLSGTGALGDYLAAAVKDKLGKKARVRADTFGYLQRSFPEGISAVDQEEARAVGRMAAELAIDGKFNNGSVAIERKSGAGYGINLKRVELSAVAAKTRVMPPEFLAGEDDVTEAFRDYLRPLLGPMPEIETL